jgi:hypothetical protein
LLQRIWMKRCMGWSMGERCRASKNPPPFHMSSDSKAPQSCPFEFYG